MYKKKVLISIRCFNQSFVRSLFQGHRFPNDAASPFGSLQAVAFQRRARQRRGAATVGAYRKTIAWAAMPLM